MREQRKRAGQGRKLGDPAHTANAILQVVDAERPPLRLILGTEGLPMFKHDYAGRIAEWDAWQEVSSQAQ